MADHENEPGILSAIKANVTNVGGSLDDLLSLEEFVAQMERWHQRQGEAWARLADRYRES